MEVPFYTSLLLALLLTLDEAALANKNICLDS